MGFTIREGDIAPLACRGPARAIICTFGTAMTQAYEAAFEL